MRILNNCLSLVLLLSIPALSTQGQRRQAARPAQKPAPTTVSQRVTFENLLANDRYKVYVEVRGVGQLMKSDSVNDLLEPVLKLAEPPKEFTEFIRWIDAHADAVMTSRMLLATWPTAKNVPDAVFAIEFESPDQAVSFLPKLNTFLPKVIPQSKAVSPTSSSPTEGEQKPEANGNETRKPSFFIEQAGSLLLISPTPVSLDVLRPPASKLLTDQASFRVAQNRFASEQLFVYVDVNSIEKEADEERQRDQELRKRTEESTNGAVTGLAPSPTEPQEIQPEQNDSFNPPLDTQAPEQSPSPTPDPMSVLSAAAGPVVSSLFAGETKWPDAIGIGISLGSNSFDLRALMINKPGEKGDLVPFFPNLIPGPPIVPESPSILPADTELFATLSLDLPQILAAINRVPALPNQGAQQSEVMNTDASFRPLMHLESVLQIDVNKELLPVLGSEVVVSMPVKLFDKRPIPVQAAASESGEPQQDASSMPGIVVALSLRDREGVKLLLPRIIDKLGFQGASALAQTERREDTELVSYGNLFAYALIGNFLVLSPDANATRHVVDCYLRHETLSSDVQFRNYTRWQPHQLNAQIYVSPALMNTYKIWSEESGSLLSDQTKEFLSRLSVIPEPVTYALSNDGLGTLHELHVPKNLALMAVAGMSAESNPPPMIANERNTMSALYMIANVEAQYRAGEGQGSFGSLEKLLENEMVTREFIENHGYRIELTLTGNKFEVTATPLEYGKSGKLSYYIDESNVLRGADRAGGIATSADNPVH